MKYWYFNPRMYTDCKNLPRLVSSLFSSLFQPTHVHGLQALPMLEPMRVMYIFQPTHVHGLQGHEINSRPCLVLCFPFREPPIRGPLTRCTQGCFAQIMVSCWTYFLPGFCRAVPVISTPALLGSGKSKRTQLCCYPIL